MDLLNGHAGRLREASLALPLVCNRMEVCSVLPTIHSLRKNAGQNAMGRSVCSMQLASVIVGDVNYVRSVRKVFPPANYDG